MTDPSPEQSVTEDPQPRHERSWWKALKENLPWSSGAEPTMREALAELIEEGDETGAPMDAHERLLLGNILHLRDVTAADVMMPRADIVAVAIDTPLADLMRLIVAEGVSRLPVYRETLDDAVGLVHIKDAVQHFVGNEDCALGKMLRPILFVAPSMRVMDLLLEMRVKRTHMALVIDEYGGVDGLVTIEDLVEQIVGEIDDEHDDEADPELVWRSDTVIEADARVSIEDFEHAVGPLLTADERDAVDTLGGLVFSLAGHIPARGELVPHESGIEFQIIDADPRRIKRMRVRNLPPGSAPDARS